MSRTIRKKRSCGCYQCRNKSIRIKLKDNTSKQEVKNAINNHE